MNERKSLEALRTEIDEINREIAGLYAERMALCPQFAAVKRERKLAAYDPVQEEKTIAAVCEAVPEGERAGAEELFRLLMRQARERQALLMGETEE